MFQIYYQDCFDKTNKPVIIAFADSLESAKEKLKIHAQKFIVDNEGTNKLTTAFQDDHRNIAGLSDGFYFVSYDNTSVVLKQKISTTVVYSGLFSSTTEMNYKIVDIRNYNIISFDRELINTFITVSEIPQAPVIDENNNSKEITDPKMILQTNIIKEFSRYKNIRDLLKSNSTHVLATYESLEESKKKMMERKLLKEKIQQQYKTI